LESDILDNGIEGLSSELNIALRALISGWVLKEILVDATLAVRAHAFIDGVGISVNTFA
jgi:hypothetical protein